MNRKELRRRRNGKSCPLGRGDLSSAEQQPSSPPGTRQGLGAAAQDSCRAAGLETPGTAPWLAPTRAVGTTQTPPALGSTGVQADVPDQPTHPSWHGGGCPAGPPTAGHSAATSPGPSPEGPGEVTPTDIQNPTEAGAKAPWDAVLPGQPRGGDPESVWPAELARCLRNEKHRHVRAQRLR